MIEDLGFVMRDAKNRYHWAKCSECSKVYLIRHARLNQRSCGCIPAALKHGNEIGRKKTTELGTYHKMKERCSNPNNKDYVNYGGRGIKVCDRWLESFQNFLDDMGKKPSPDLSIDRINVNGNYEPGNCRWATKSEQNRNTRKTPYIELWGERKSLLEWVEILRFERSSYYKRLAKGMSPQNALLFGYGIKYDT